MFAPVESDSLIGSKAEGLPNDASILLGDTVLEGLDRYGQSAIAQSLPVEQPIDITSSSVAAAILGEDLVSDGGSNVDLMPLSDRASESTDSLLLGGLTDLEQASLDSAVGTFTVGNSGQIDVSYLFDGGANEAELAIFGLEGMDGLSTEAFIQAATQRVLEGTFDSQVVISDSTEGAEFSGELGERSQNEGKALGEKAIALTPGTQFAVMLVPNGTVAEAAAGSQRPLFSIAALNPNGGIQIGQAAEGVFAMEDLLIGEGDADFNDIVFQLTGATSDITDLKEIINPAKNWLESPVAQPFLKEPQFSPENPPENPLPPNPPAETPPVSESPAIPPVEDPSPPVEEDPATEAPVSPPVEEQPPTSEQPPVDEPPTAPPAEEGSNEQPPVNEPPVAPPTSESPVNESPVNEPPVNEPPVNEPPVSESPVNEPPVSEQPQPPVDENPVDEPPAAPPAEEDDVPVEQPVEPVAPPAMPTDSAQVISDISGQVNKFTPDTSEAELAASGADRITIGTQTIYIGTQQVTSINQNPIIRSVDPVNPSNNWLRTDIETTGTDGRGLGLVWTGTALYGVFSVDGTQGSPSEDFRRATGGANQNWLKSFGPGGGKKISVIGQLDPATGDLLKAAHLSAVLQSGKTNSLAVTDVAVNSAGNLVVSAESFFSPRRPDGTALTKDPGNTADSPFDYTLEITPDLTEVVSTSAVGWS